MYNNPYNFYPFINQTANPVYVGAKPSLFKSLTNIKWGALLTNTQKTLNVINQAIPVYYQKNGQKHRKDVKFKGDFGFQINDRKYTVKNGQVYNQYNQNYYCRYLQRATYEP